MDNIYYKNKYLKYKNKYIENKKIYNSNHQRGGLLKWFSSESTEPTKPTETPTQKRMREVDEKKKQEQQRTEAIETKITNLFLNLPTDNNTVLDETIVLVIEKLKSFLKRYWENINSHVADLHRRINDDSYNNNNTDVLSNRLKEYHTEINNSINNLKKIVNSPNTNKDPIPWYITNFFTNNQLTVDEIKIIKDNNIIKILKSIFKRMNGYIPDNRFSPNK